MKRSPETMEKLKKGTKNLQEITENQVNYSKVVF